MESFNPSHCICDSYDAGENTVDRQSFQLGQDASRRVQYCPFHASQTAWLDSTSGNLGRPNTRQPNINMPETSFGSNFVGGNSNIDGYFDSSGAWDGMLAPRNAFHLQDDAFRVSNEPLIHRTLSMEFNSSLSPTFHSQGQRILRGSASLDFTDFNFANSVGVENEAVPLSTSDHPPQGFIVVPTAGQSDGLAGDAMIRNLVHNHMPNPEYDTSNLPISPPLISHHLDSDMEWSSMSLTSPSFHLNQMSQNGLGTVPQPELEGSAVDMPLLQLIGDHSLDNISRTSYSFLRTGEDAMSDQFAQDFLPSPPEKSTTVAFRRIEPKPIKVHPQVLGTSDRRIAKRKTPCNGGRQDRLTDEQREAAAIMRIKGACVMCVRDKKKCSVGIPCSRCQKKFQQSTYGFAGCIRGSLIKHLELFSPFFLTEHLEPVAIANWTSGLHYINNKITVHMSAGSTGHSHPTLKLSVREFRPPSRNFLRVSDIKSESNDQTAVYPSVTTYPFGIHDMDFADLKTTCLEYVKASSNYEFIGSDHNSIRRKTLQVICKFQRADPIAQDDELLQNAIMISQINYIMGEKIRFTRDSMSKVKDCLPNLRKVALGPYSRSSRVIGRQIKGAMNILSRELTNKVLSDLDWLLNQKKPESWAICLCVHLILCTCVEELQVSIDMFINIKISAGAENPKQIRDWSAEFCRRLERETLIHSLVLLGGVLKGILRNKNPFINGCSINDKFIQSQAQVDLVHDVQKVISDHKKEIFEKANDEYFGCSAQVVAENKKFRQSNTGRLLSKVFKRLVANA